MASTTTAPEDIALCNPQKAIPLSFDLGNLAAFDPNPLPEASLTNESSLQSIARDTTQLLVNELLALPRTRSNEGVFIQLPAATSDLPREKPLPKPKPPTKWELFAKKKGIQKTAKTPNTVYDEETGEWVPRWGYKGANKKAENEWLIELPSQPEGQEDTSDPRSALKKDRKDRVAANEGKERRNKGDEKLKKKTVTTDVVTRKLAQRLRKSRVGKAIGGKSGRRR